MWGLSSWQGHEDGENFESLKIAVQNDVIFLIELAQTGMEKVSKFYANSFIIFRIEKFLQHQKFLPRI